MRRLRNIVGFVVVVGGAFLMLSPDRRAALAEKLAEARRLISRRATDRDERASRTASETWDSEGGAIPAPGAQLR